MTKCPGKSKRSKGESLGPAAPAWDKERLSLLSAKKQNKREKHRMRSCSVLVTFSRGQTVIAPHANSGHWRHDSPASRISTPSARRLTEPRSPITAQPHHVTLPRCPAEPPKGLWGRGKLEESTRAISHCSQQPSGQVLECASQEKQHEHVPGDTRRDKGRKPGSGRWRLRGNKTRSYPKKSGAMRWGTEVKEVRCFFLSQHCS